MDNSEIDIWQEKINSFLDESDIRNIYAAIYEFSHRIAEENNSNPAHMMKNVKQYISSIFEDEFTSANVQKYALISLFTYIMLKRKNLPAQNG